MQQVVADRAISLLDEALPNCQTEDISVVVRLVRDMLFNARKEMSQEKGQEDRRKKTHDTFATPSSTTRAPAKEKAASKEKAAPTKEKAASKEKAAPAKEKAPARTMTRAQARASVGSTTRTPVRAPTKTKGPARKKANN